jgi:hypothetical protein
MDEYKVRPRKTRDGWNLESERLSHGSLWYEDPDAAVSFALWHSRTKGCRVEIFNEREALIEVKETPTGNFAY